MTPSASQQREVVLEAARAPSVHNIQPARWRFGQDSVTLFRALDRTLPVADPSGHDLRASLGAAFEGMTLALSTRGIILGAPRPATDIAPPGCEVVATASLTTGAKPDHLASYVATRRSYRGRFVPVAESDANALAAAIDAPDVIVAKGRSVTREVATLHDVATWTFESKPEYHAELWKWLRLSRSDPRYGRDGLNGDCLALSPVEQWAAARLLAPPVFSRLKSLGVARYLVSEASQVRSAAVVVLFTPTRELDAFDVGRRMYRLWLEITRAGFYLAPMSASADDANVREVLSRKFGVPADRRIANVFRVGRMNASGVAVSPRLPLDELIV